MSVQHLLLRSWIVLPARLREGKLSECFVSFLSRSPVPWMDAFSVYTRGIRRNPFSVYSRNTPRRGAHWRFMCSGKKDGFILITSPSFLASESDCVSGRFAWRVRSSHSIFQILSIALIVFPLPSTRHLYYSLCFHPFPAWAYWSSSIYNLLPRFYLVLGFPRSLCVCCCCILCISGSRYFFFCTWCGFQNHSFCPVCVDCDARHVGL